MAKREKNPASDKTGNDTGISLLVLGQEQPWQRQEKS